MNKQAATPAPTNKSSWAAFKRFIKTPKGYALGALILLTLVGSTSPQGHMGIQHALAAVIAAAVFDAAVAKLLKRRVTVSTGGIITGLIVADVLSGLDPLYVVVLTTLIALASKHLLKRGRKPIFNPAAVGLLAAIGIFGAAESWWAGMALMPVWYLALMLAVGIFVSIRVKKYPQALTFMATYLLGVLAMAYFHLGLASATPADALREPFINSALFLGFFMLTDPPTSPGTTPEQVVFSIITGIVSVGMFMTFGGLTYLLVGLLAGNVFTAVLAQLRSPVKKSTKVETPNRASASSGA